MRRHAGTATRDKLLDAAVSSIREKGYAATKVDELCAATALTKGAFFHHFESKDALALAAIEHFARRAGEMFAGARWRTLADPRARILGYVDMRIAMLDGKLTEVTCLHGTLLQEIYATHPALRAAAARHLEDGTKELTADLAAAKKRYASRARWKPESLALFVQASVQGAFVMAKASQSTKSAAECLKHLRTYLETQLPTSQRKEAT
jgi:TetR/AcrR family transcriptional repressor of nem operon